MHDELTKVDIQKMQEEIGKRMKFTSIRYQRLDDMIEAIGVDRERLCTYCWDGRE